MQMVGPFAYFERFSLRKRTRVGLDAALRAGRVGSRRPKLTRAQQQQEVTSLVVSGQKSSADTARLFQVHPATFSRLVAKLCAEQFKKATALKPPARKKSVAKEVDSK